MLHDLTLVLKVFRPQTVGFLAPNRGVSRPDPRVFHPPLGFSTRPSGVSRPDPRVFLKEKLRLRQCLMPVYAAISIYQLVSFRQALHTKENFSTFQFVCELMAEN